MFAYCLNNPVSMQDDDGHFGILTLCAAGAFIGGLINYAGQVYENYTNGKTGADAWTDVNVGEIAGATFSGAVSAIPGSAAWKDVVDAAGSNIIESGVNALVYGEEFDCVKVGRNIVSDYAASTILPDLLPMSDMPYFIRDIKDEARSAGVKGTRRLQAYLNMTQISTLVVNGFNGDTSDRLYEAAGLG